MDLRKKPRGLVCEKQVKKKGMINSVYCLSSKLIFRFGKNGGHFYSILYILSAHLSLLLHFKFSPDEKKCFSLKGCLARNRHVLENGLMCGE